MENFFNIFLFFLLIVFIISSLSIKNTEVKSKLKCSNFEFEFKFQNKEIFGGHQRFQIVNLVNFIFVSMLSIFIFYITIIKKII